MNGRFSAGWRQVGASLVIAGAGAMISTSFSVIAVPLSVEFQPSRLVLMLAITVMSLVVGLIGPYLGGLMDRKSLRLLMALGVLLMVAGFIALSFATAFSQVLVIYGLLMAPASMLCSGLAATVLLSRWFVKMRGRAIGLALTGASLGGLFFPPLIQLLLDLFAWREAMRLLALIVLVMTLPAALFVINRPSDVGLQPDGEEHDLEPQQIADEAIALSARTLLSDPTFWTLSLVMAIVFAGMLGTVTSLVPIAMDEGISPAAAALLISIMSACGLVAKLGFAALADRLDLRHLLYAAIAGFAAGVGCMVAAQTGYTMIVAGVALIGFSGGVMSSLQGLLVARIFGPHVVGQVSGMMGPIILGVVLATPPAFGFVSDATGDYDVIFLIFAGLSVAAMLAVPFIRMDLKVREKRKSLVQQPVIVP